MHDQRSFDRAFRTHLEKKRTFHLGLPRWSRLMFEEEPPLPNWRQLWSWGGIPDNNKMPLLTAVTRHLLQGEHYIMVDYRMMDLVHAGLQFVGGDHIGPDELHPRRIWRGSSPNRRRAPWAHEEPYISIYNLGNLSTQPDYLSRIDCRLTEDGLVRFQMRPRQFRYLSGLRTDYSVSVIEGGFIAESNPIADRHEPSIRDVQVLIHPIPERPRSQSARPIGSVAVAASKALVTVET